MSIASPSITLLAPIEGLPVLTEGRFPLGWSSGHAPKYTLDNDPDTWWEPDSVATNGLYYDMGVPVEIDAIVFWLHNYNENYGNEKSWRVSYSVDDTTYTPLTTKFFKNERTTYTPLIVDILTGGPITSQYWLIEFIGFDDVPITFAPSVSAVWFMKDYSLPWNAQIPQSNKLLYRNNETITRSGHHFASPAGIGKQRVLQRQFIFPDSTAQWDNLKDAYDAARGQNLPIIMQTEPESNEYYAVQFDTPLAENRQEYDLWKPQLRLRELGHDKVPFQNYRLSELEDTVAIWRFQQNANDATDNGHDFTNTGYDDADYENGHVEQGITVLRAQAANNLSIASGSATDFDLGISDVTIEAWIFMSSALAGSDRSFLAKISFGPTTGWAFTHDGTYKVGLNMGDGTTGLFLSNGVATNDNTWHLHTAVIDRTANTLTWYMDGVFLRSDSIASITGDISNAGQPFSLGSQAQSDVVWWDEICITKRTLSATEILNRYNGSLDYGSWGM